MKYWDAFIAFLEKIITSDDFGTLLGFALTAFIVWVTSRHQSKQFLKTIESQERIANQNMCSARAEMKERSRQFDEKLNFDREYAKAQLDEIRKQLKAEQSRESTRLLHEKKGSQLNRDAEKEKARLEFIAQNRQNWIERFRDYVSEFLTIASKLNYQILYLYNIKPGDKACGRPELIEHEAIFHEFIQLKITEAKIALLLDSNGTNNVDIISCMAKIRDVLSSKIKSSNQEEKPDKNVTNEYALAIDEMSSLSKEILKLEWIRMEKMED